MFTLRRCAVRALHFQPTRQLSTFRPISSAFQTQQPTLRRSFHQSRKWLADEQKKEESPAEQQGGETVTAEPSAEEQKSEIKEESVATSEVADAAQETPAPSEGAAQEAAQEVRSATEAAKETVASAAETLQNAASGAAQTARSAFSGREGGREGARDREPSKILYVGNLFFEVTTPQLEAEFGRYGEITNSRIVTDARGLSKGFGYIEFATQESADRASRELDQKVFQGRRMAVQYHVRKDPRSQRAPKRDNPPSKTLFIGNMSYQMSDRDLNDLFREIRNVLDVRVAIDRRSGQPRGFAHADFIDISSAERAKAHLEKKVVYGRQLRVDFSSSSGTATSSST